MKNVKCNLLAPGTNGLSAFIEAAIDSHKIREFKTKNKNITIDGIIKELLSRVVNEWSKTDEGKDLKQITLETLGEILEDTYYTKYISLRKIIKDHGFVKLRIRIIEVSQELKMEESMKNKATIAKEDSVDALADLLSGKG